MSDGAHKDSTERWTRIGVIAWSLVGLLLLAGAALWLVPSLRSAFTDEEKVAGPAASSVGPVAAPTPTPTPTPEVAKPDAAEVIETVEKLLAAK